MKVSIIIPIFNVESCIKRCIDSVINQTYSNIEVILVDDRSSDSSLDIAKMTLENFNFPEERVKFIIHSKNKGVSAARNSGINASTGEALFFLDSDDSISPNCIESLVKTMTRTNADVASAGFQIVTDSSIRESRCIESILDSDGVLKSFLNYKLYIMVWNKLISKSFLVENKLYFKEGIIHEDEIWSFMMASCIKRMATINSITYSYFIRENSIMRSICTKNSIDNILVLRYLTENLSTKSISFQMIKYLDNFIFWRYYGIQASNLSTKDRYKRHQLIAKYHKEYLRIVPHNFTIVKFLSFPYRIGFSLSVTIYRLLKIKNLLISLITRIKEKIHH